VVNVGFGVAIQVWDALVLQGHVSTRPPASLAVSGRIQKEPTLVSHKLIYQFLCDALHVLHAQHALFVLTILLSLDTFYKINIASFYQV
jgi:hypothetical protein